jgi:hypothetical protein
VTLAGVGLAAHSGWDLDYGFVKIRR